MKTNRLILAGLASIMLLAFAVVEEKHGYDRSNIDPNASPCNDFYQYAIGGWQEKNPLPSTESRWAVFNILNKENEERIELILDRLIKSKEEYPPQSVEQQVKDYFLSVMDSQAREEKGVLPIKSMQQRINDCNSREELLELVANWQQKGVGGFFGLYVSTDAKNSDMNVLHLSQGGLHLPDIDYYTRQDSAGESIRKAYVEHMVKMLGFMATDTSLPAKAGEVLKFETKLANVSMSRTEQRDPDKTYNLYKRGGFEAEFPGLDWKRYFELSRLSGWTKIIVGQPEFLKNAIALWNEADLEVLKTYVSFELISSYAGNLNQATEREQFRFYSGVLRGTETMKPLKERAVRKVNGGLGELVGMLYVREYFPEASKKMVSQMVEEIRAVFRERIQNLEWMGDTTRQQALEKLNAFKYKIGYPDKWHDYANLEISSENLVANTDNIRELAYERMIEKLERPVDRSEWNMTPQTVNAYYSSSKNEIVFPAGILQPPFFDPNAEAALNYGGIGAVIGHEFSHGFDDKGSKFDAAGNLHDWWTAHDRQQFNLRTRKIVAQFDAFEVLPGVHINGSLTQGENIADLAGLTLAYYALKNHYGSQAPAGKGKDGFTWQQRFFLGWAQVWAQNIAEKELRNRILTDPHSPGRYRVLGPLANLPEFAEAFSCTEGGVMVEKDPEKRVVIW